MQYKYETHAHTSQTSRCSRISGADMVHVYKSLGYAGLFITDHFFNGNTTVDRDLEWRERVEMFEKGYLDAKQEGDALGLDVFMAWEYSWRGNDFLIYGLDRDWLFDHPDQLEWKPRDYMNRVAEDGGLVVHAHPFREAGYIEAIKLIPAETEGVEIINSSRTDLENSAASWYADFYGKLKFAGSDNHSGKMKRLSGLAFSHRISSVSDFVSSVRGGSYELFDDFYD